MDRRLLDEARDALHQLHATGKYPALQACVRHRGEVVLHKTLGEFRPLNDSPDSAEAENLKPRPATHETRFLTFSISKCISAVALHILFDREQLHVDDPVHWYIPEFAQHGKEHVTFRHLLTHTAGIPMLFWHLDDDLIRDWDRIILEICQQEPAHFPGRHASYHILSSGFLIGETIRRVDGRDLRTFLREEIRQPMNLESFDFGAPHDAFDRVARVERVDRLPPRWIVNILSRTMDVDLEEALAVVNRPAVYDSVIPAGNIVATAEEVSRFFQMLLDGGVWNDHRILSEQQVERATVEQVLARTDWTLFLTPQRYSLGFMLGREHTPFNIFGRNTEETFGHIGFTRSLAWANPKNQVSAAFLTSGVPIRPSREVFILRRFQNKIRRACQS